MRTAFIRTLEELAAVDDRITLVVGDLGFSVIESFATRFPRQFLNAGVAEQNMTGIAVGMALSGKIVFTYSIANFPTLRCLEQIRNDACYHRANLKVVSVGGGLAYGALGSSHHATEDLAIMRALPEMIVIAPGDPIEAEAATRAVIAHDGPCYLRLGKAGEAVLHTSPPAFEIGRAVTVRDGSALTIIAAGGILSACVEAADRLSARGLSVRLLSMHTVKPIDHAAIERANAETDAILTVEEHSVIGGLGGAVAEVLAQLGPAIVPFKVLGLRDGFTREVGGQGYLRAVNGLTIEGIIQAGESVIDRAVIRQSR